VPRRMLHRATVLAASALLASTISAVCAAHASADLPDNRAYELVSPPSKRGADVIAQSYKTFAAADGNGVTFPATGAFGDVRGTATDVQYLSRRNGAPGTSGWMTHAISPPSGSQTLLALAFSNFPTFEAAFTDDLSGGVYKSWRPLTDAPTVAGVSNLYRLRNLDASVPQVELMTAGAAPLAATPTFLRQLFQNAFDGASKDLTHVLFQSPWNLVGDGGFSLDGDLYEFADGVGVRRVGRIPSAPDSACDEVDGPACVDASAQAGISASLAYGGSQHSAGMISDDGSRIIFQAAGAIYMREDGVRTFQLNASEKSTPETSQSAAAWDMSRDGARVFFTTSEGLVEGDDGGADLYVYDRRAPEGARLTRLSLNSAGDSCDVQGVVGASSTGRAVYFICNGQLVAGEPLALVGLFLWRDGTHAYLGRFENFNFAVINTPRTPWQFSFVAKASRVTPDGRFVLFTAFSGDGFRGVGGFGGYDHADHRQLYLYSADRGTLVCVSCNPRTAAAAGDAMPGIFAGASASPLTQHLSHALSDDGRRVFFSTPEALVADDSNGMWDAYEYDVLSGTLHLISSGKDPADSYFLEATASGDDVFFVTRERLVGWDVDDSYDLYDARVGGGFPDPAPAAPVCTGETCRAPVTGPPAAAPGASAHFRGAGDATPRLRRHKQCRRGRVVRRVRGRRKCVHRRGRNPARTGRHVEHERSGK
jgi:hypothetical protein